MTMIKILILIVTKLTTMKMFAAETLQNSTAPNNKTKGILHLSLEYIILKKSQPRTEISISQSPVNGFPAVLLLKPCHHL